MRPVGENTAKHPRSALTVFLGVAVTSCACPSHSHAQVPIMALCGIPMPSNQLGSSVLSWLPQVPPGYSIKGAEKAAPWPCKPHMQGALEPQGLV